MAFEKDEFLMHYGVKGMKWGQRRAQRKVEKAARNETRNKSIDEARERIKSGETKRRYKEALREYKVDRKQMGDKLAADKLRKAIKERDDDYTTSQMTKSGKERRQQVILTTSLVSAAVAVHQGAKWMANNPEVVSNITQRASNLMNGTKAIGPGYEVFSLALKNGVYS